jgi:hypothetical protein
MRKVVLVVGAVVANLIATSVAAFAQSSLPGPQGPNVQGDVVTPPGGTAFTGGDVLTLALAAAVLLTVGVTFVVLGRRRAASAA